MSDQQGAAVAVEAPPAPAKPEPRTPSKPKRQPPYAVVLLNDDEHTFDYVIELLMRTFGYDIEKAVTLTMQVHVSGRAAVWTGTMELAELKRDQVRGFGPDFYARKPVKYPLGCVIEPLPQ